MAQDGGKVKKYEYQEYFLGGKDGRCIGLTTLPPSCAECHEISEPQPPGTLWACLGLQWVCFTFTFIFTSGVKQTYVRYSDVLKKPEMTTCSFLFSK